MMRAGQHRLIVVLSIATTLATMPACQPSGAVGRLNKLSPADARQFAYSLHERELASDLGVSDIHVATIAPLIGSRVVYNDGETYTWEVRPPKGISAVVEPLNLPTTAFTAETDVSSGVVSLSVETSEIETLLSELDTIYVRIEFTHAASERIDRVVWSLDVVEYEAGVQSQSADADIEDTLQGPGRVVLSDYTDSNSPTWTVVTSKPKAEIQIVALDADIPVVMDTTGIFAKGTINTNELKKARGGVSLTAYHYDPENGPGVIGTKRVEVTEEFGWIEADFQIEDAISAQTHFGELFESTFFPVKVFITNRYDVPVTVNSGSIELPIQYAARIDRPDRAHELDPAHVLIGEGIYSQYYVTVNDRKWLVWNELRQPMDFSAILSVFQYHQRNSSEQLTVNALRMIGARAGAAAVFIDSEDYAKIVAFFAGPFTETVAEALLRELVNSLEFMNAQALKEITTIPPGTTIAKYVFYPKSDIYGVWGLDLPVRIVRVQEDDNIQLTGTVQRSQEPAVLDTQK